MRVLRFVGLGIVIWGLSLLWPQANQLLTPPIVSGIVLGLGAVAFAYVAIQRLDHGQGDDGTSQDRPSRPMPVTATR
jgi:threonine/homoserine/homoserine lactone efflux protein